MIKLPHLTGAHLETAYAAMFDGSDFTDREGLTKFFPSFEMLRLLETKLHKYINIKQIIIQNHRFLEFFILQEVKILES